MPKVLVTDSLDQSALDLLGQGAEVVYSPGATPSDLIRLIGDADGLVVRSGTKVTNEAIAAGAQLRVIGRAGAGVDNIAVEAATRRGIWVVNAPDSNSVAVAEHVFALMLSLARRIPLAAESVARGEWRRQAFQGEELQGKTLGIIGLGRIGRRVAERARAFGMTILAHDPFVAPNQAEGLGVRLISLDELLSAADFISIHVPAGSETDGLLGETRLSRCKPGSYLVNCSRGSVVDEPALLAALDSGRLAGAGLDVFATEPPSGSLLIRHPHVIATPHIGGMTREAQQNVALAVAEQVLAVLRGAQPTHPVNAPALTAEEQARIGPYLDLARRLGRLYAAIAEAPTISVEVCHAGLAAEMETALITASLLQGLLEQVSETPLNTINARMAALSRGISVSETTSAQTGPYSSLLSLTVRTPTGEHRLAGTILHGQPYVVRIEDFWITFVPAGTLLYTEHIEQPGILGRMGTLLGEQGVNISFVQVGRSARGGAGVMILGIDDALSGPGLEAVRALPSVRQARLVRLPPASP